jgi:hypothetical protein
VHPSDGSLPDGQVFHAAGPSAGGWTIIAVHESKESWERFRDGILMSRMQQGIEGGFPTPPEEIAIDVYRSCHSGRRPELGLRRSRSDSEQPQRCSA